MQTSRSILRAAVFACAVFASAQVHAQMSSCGLAMSPVLSGSSFGFASAMLPSSGFMPGDNNVPRSQGGGARIRPRRIKSAPRPTLVDQAKGVDRADTAFSIARNLERNIPTAAEQNLALQKSLKAYADVIAKHGGTKQAKEAEARIKALRGLEAGRHPA